MMTVAAVYQSNEQVKTMRRPNQSAANPKSMVPMKRPAKVAATKLARPLNPKNDAEELGNSPLRTRPGPMYAVKKRSYTSKHPPRESSSTSFQMYCVAGSRSSRALISAAMVGLPSCVNISPLSFLFSVELLLADPMPLAGIYQT